MTNKTTYLDYIKDYHTKLFEHYEFIFRHQCDNITDLLDLAHSKADALAEIEKALKANQKLLSDPGNIGIKKFIDIPLSELQSKLGEAYSIEKIKSALDIENVSTQEFRELAVEQATSTSDKNATAAVFDVVLNFVENGVPKFTRKASVKFMKEYAPSIEGLVKKILIFNNLRKFHAFLIDQYNAHNNAQGLIPKLPWLGSQQDLAELIVELQAKCFLPKDLDVRKVQAAFTKSTSIDKLLAFKGEYSVADSRYLYPNIYRNNKEAKFSRIKTNEKPKGDS